jgi:MinD-like ATPase involved in chromosome partitioning or flagellar assembly
VPDQAGKAQQHGAESTGIHAVFRERVDIEDVAIEVGEGVRVMRVGVAAEIAEVELPGLDPAVAVAEGDMPT